MSFVKIKMPVYFITCFMLLTAVIIFPPGTFCNEGDNASFEIETSNETVDTSEERTTFAISEENNTFAISEENNTFAISEENTTYPFSTPEALEKLQDLLEKPKIRFLMLDRNCEILEKRHLKVRFLFTKAFMNSEVKSENKNCWVELKQNGKVPKRLWKSGVDTEIRILIHGYVTKVFDDEDVMINDQHMYEMGEEYGRLREDLNIFVVDWTSIAAVGSFKPAAFSTRHVGFQVAKYLIKLHRRNNLTLSDWEKVHIVGFSLGAHVAGIVGYHLQQLLGAPIGRITGLDPTGPEFDGPNGTIPTNVSAFLDKTDARFVDIIHCNMGISPNWTVSTMIGRFGSWVQSGHADFYPNGGEHQPRYCNESANAQGCSHNICLQFFISSIRNIEYLACRCDSWKKFKTDDCSPCKRNGREGTLMGDRCDKTASGKYFLRTYKKPELKVKVS